MMNYELFFPNMFSLALIYLQKRLIDHPVT